MVGREALSFSSAVVKSDGSVTFSSEVRLGTVMFATEMFGRRGTALYVLTNP